MLTTELLAATLVLTAAADGCRDGRPFVRVSLEWQARSIPMVPEFVRDSRGRSSARR